MERYDELSIQRQRMNDQFLWKGEPNRPLATFRPCRCGCDYRDGIRGVGYLSASDDEGNGFTFWIRNERTYTRLKLAIRSATRAKEASAKKAQKGRRDLSRQRQKLDDSGVSWLNPNAPAGASQK